ncbi:HAD family hydrolase [Nakamurella endophytica]|uniref:Haloacid dehalogenase n=1 Tax=Nakamurella endophytica TaxID=1748367 RepID=A0A917WN65_9ACTN|nr:HAD family hydrolase [Nakamurella endophytica]GGM16517.1 haloacid dehalogenase [Nakamurella endophytica]
MSALPSAAAASPSIPAAAVPSGATVSPVPRLVACDMDGTLLDLSGARVSDRNVAALRRAADRGARVVIATGRPVWWLDPVLETGFRGTAVCMNGAVVYDTGTRDIVSASPLTPEAMQDFLSGLERELAGADRFSVAVERLGTTVDECFAEADYDHPWSTGHFRLTDREDLLSAPAAKMLVRAGHDSDTLAAAARAVGDDQVAITFSSSDGLIEIAAAGVNKGSTLARLAAEWGIDAAEVVAFGDMPNDLEMLRWAGRGVAMGNGHPDVVAAADEQAPHHGDDGVAAVLERWF